MEHAARLAMIRGVIDLMRLELDDREVEYRLACDDYLAAAGEAGMLKKPEPQHTAFHEALNRAARTSIALGVLVELADSFTPKAEPVGIEAETVQPLMVIYPPDERWTDSRWPAEQAGGLIVLSAEERATLEGLRA